MCITAPVGFGPRMGVRYYVFTAKISVIMNRLVPSMQHFTTAARSGGIRCIFVVSLLWFVCSTQPDIMGKRYFICGYDSCSFHERAVAGAEGLKKEGHLDLQVCGGHQRFGHLGSGEVRGVGGGETRHALGQT